MKNQRQWSELSIPARMMRIWHRVTHQRKPIMLDRDSLPEWEYRPEGWQAENPAREGWNVPSIAELQKQKWLVFVEALKGHGPLGISHEAPADAGCANLWAHNLIMSYAYVLTLAARHKERLSMLDSGGGVGHYYMISRALLPDLELNYYCQDLPNLCKVGRSLLPMVHFFDTPDACFKQSYDFVLSGSSLWYEQNWKSAADKLARVTDHYLYINRILFIDKAASFVILQRPWKYGYLTEYQCWVINQHEFLSYIESLGLQLVREFLFGPGPHIDNAPEQGYFKGFLFKRPEKT